MGPLIHGKDPLSPLFKPPSILWFIGNVGVFLLLWIDDMVGDQSGRVAGPFGTSAIFWLQSRVFGGLLVSPQGHNIEEEVYWDGSRPADLLLTGLLLAGLSWPGRLAGQPARAALVIFQVA